VLLFARNKEREVQGFILKLVNNNCSELESLMEGPRLEGRANLTIVVRVVPLEKGQPRFGQTFAAVTKEFATAGVSLVLHEPKALDEAILCVRWEGAMKYILGKAKHLNPMGAGFYQVGLKLRQMVHPGDYPGLEKITL
jgi:hypothetical protein